MKRLINQNGSAMIASILASVLVVGASTVAYRNYSLTHASVRNARIRSLMNVVESQVRRRALQPEAYINCNSTGGSASCQPNPAFFLNLAGETVPGAKCPGGPGAKCGVQVSNIGFSASSKTFTARISYAGEDLRLKPIDVAMQVPTEVLQLPRLHCGSINGGTTPVFTGFNPDGSPNCQGFNTCPVGQFVKQVDVSNRRLICADLPPPVTCGTGKLIMFNWVGGNIQYNCSALTDPPFVEKTLARIPASLPSPNRTPPTIVTITNTSTSISVGPPAVTPTPTPTPGPAPAPTPTPGHTPQWTYVGENVCADASGGLDLGGYGINRAVGTGIDAYTCGQRVFWGLDGETMTLYPNSNCDAAGSKCSIYLYNPNGGWNGNMCWECR